MRSGASLGAKELVPQWVVDNTRHHLTTERETDTDAKSGKPVRKIGGAIEGVDVPHVFGPSLDPAAFFRDD